MKCLKSSVQSNHWRVLYTFRNMSFLWEKTPNNNSSNNKKHFTASQCSCQRSLSPTSHLYITIYIYLYICCYLHYITIQADTYRRLSTQWKLASLGSDLVSGSLFLYMWHLCTGLGALPWCSFSCWLGAKHRFVLPPPSPTSLQIQVNSAFAVGYPDLQERGWSQTLPTKARKGF